MGEIPMMDWSWINAAADRFDRAWQAGHRPRIEDFLAKVPEPHRPPFLGELLRVEVELRRIAGEEPTAEEYRARFPGYGRAVESVFEPGTHLTGTLGEASPPGVTRDSSPSAALADGSLPAELAHHPGYEIIGELGGGGMGVVYLAHNRLMGRDEVLKVMGQHIVGQPGLLDRFHREIRAVAQLRHPNIVSAYHAFWAGESLVFTMEYVKGLDLARMVKAKGPMPVANACNYVHQAALGLQHAHEEGMVHRDIKPSNLMLSHQGNRPVIKLLDFGLARAGREQQAAELRQSTSRSADVVIASLTRTGDLLGTPDFIAPEQIVDSQAADIRADIYSLGCTFYCLLTGRAPFQGPLANVLHAHRSSIPPALDLVRPDVSAEIAALIARMMAKAPEDRFQEPAEIARTLAPIARKRGSSSASVGLSSLPPGGEDAGLAALELTQVAPDRDAPSRAPIAETNLGASRPEPSGWVPIRLDESQHDRNASDTGARRSPNLPRRRRPAPAIAAGCVALLVGVTVVAFVSRRGGTPSLGPDAIATEPIPRAPSPERPAGEHVDLAEAKAAPGPAPVPKTPKPADKSPRPEKGPIVPAPPREAGRPKPAPLPGDAPHEIASFNLPHPVAQMCLLRDGRSVLFETNGPGRALWSGELAVPAAVRKREDPSPPWSHLAVHDDGRLAVATCPDRTLWRWDLQTGQARRLRGERAGLTAPAISPDGGRVAYACGDTIQVCDAATGEKEDLVNRKLRGLVAARIHRLVFGSDGRRAVSLHADGAIRAWDLRKGEAIQDLSAPDGLPHVAVFPDGHRALTMTSHGIIGLVDLDGGRRRGFGRLKDVADVAVSPDGRRALFAALTSVVCQDLETGGEVLRIEHDRRVDRVAFSPDGRLAAFTAAGNVRVWTLPPGRAPGEAAPILEVVRYEGHTNCVWALALSPDGLSLLTASHDSTVKLWETRTGRLLHTFSEPGSHVKSVAFLPDGRHGLSAGDDDAVRLFDLTAGTQQHAFEGHTGDIHSMAVSPDGSLGLTGGADMTVRVWDLEGRREAIPPLRGHRASVVAVAFLPGGRRALSASEDGTMRLWSLNSGDEPRVYDPQAGPIWCMAASPDGRSALLGCDDHTIRVINLSTWTEIGRLEGHGNAVECLAFTPDGLRAVSGAGGEVRIWDLPGRRTVGSIGRFSDKVRDLVIARDGRLLAVAFDDGTARLWQFAGHGQAAAASATKSSRHRARPKDAPPR